MFALQCPGTIENINSQKLLPTFTYKLLFSGVIVSVKQNNVKMVLMYSHLPKNPINPYYI